MSTIIKLVCDLCGKECSEEELCVFQFTYRRRIYRGDYTRTPVYIELDVCTACEVVEDEVRKSIEKQLNTKFL
jgi:hypothetical protein